MALTRIATWLALVSVAAPSSAARSRLGGQTSPNCTGVIGDAFAREFAAEWVAAWNAHDMVRILHHYADDFEMFSPLIVERMKEPAGILRGQAVRVSKTTADDRGAFVVRLAAKVCGLRRLEVVDQIFTSWNRIGAWLRQIEALKRVA